MATKKTTRAPGPKPLAHDEPTPAPKTVMIPKEAKPKHAEGTWLKATYDGSAMDHEVIVEVLRKGDNDKKPNKRDILQPMSLKRFPMRSKEDGSLCFPLWGVRFPAGEEITVLKSDPQFNKHVSFAKFALKLQSLSCFTLECDASLLDKEVKRKRDLRKSRKA